MIIGGGGIAPVADLRAAGVPVGLGCDGSASADCASLWLEARGALLLGRMRGGPASTGARDALEIGTRGSACLGREGELGVLEPGAAGGLVCWPLEGIAFAGALSDPVEAWLRCGPVSARHTVVAGRAVVATASSPPPGRGRAAPVTGWPASASKPTEPFRDLVTAIALIPSQFRPGRPRDPGDPGPDRAVRRPALG